MTAPTVRHGDVGDKYATCVLKIKKLEVGRASLECENSEASNGQVSLEQSEAL